LRGRSNPRQGGAAFYNLQPDADFIKSQAKDLKLHVSDICSKPFLIGSYFFHFFPSNPVLNDHLKIKRRTSIEYPLPDHTAKMPAIHHQIDAISQDSFTAGPHLEAQPSDEKISSGHSTTSAHKRAPSTDPDPGHNERSDQHGIYWPIPRKMLASFLFGALAAGAHSAWYGHLDTKIVKSPSHQENNIRFATPLFGL